MKRNWTSDELLDHFTILEIEFELVSKHKGSGKLGFLVMLKFFQIEARFPSQKEEIPQTIIKFIAQQFRSAIDTFENYQLEGRTFKRHKQQIRQHFGFKESDVDSYNKVNLWLSKNAQWHDQEKVRSYAYRKFRELKVEPPTSDRITKLVDSVMNTSEQYFFQSVYNKLSQDTMDRIDMLLQTLSKNELDDWKCYI